MLKPLDLPIALLWGLSLEVPSSDQRGFLSGLARTCLLLVLIVSPWLFGGVYTHIQFWLYIGILVALGIWIPAAIWRALDGITDDAATIDIPFGRGRCVRDVSTVAAASNAFVSLSSECHRIRHCEIQRRRRTSTTCKNVFDSIGSNGSEHCSFCDEFEIAG